MQSLPAHSPPPPEGSRPRPDPSPHLTQDPHPNRYSVISSPIICDSVLSAALLDPGIDPTHSPADSRETRGAGVTRCVPNRPPNDEKLLSDNLIVATLIYVTSYNVWSCCLTHGKMMSQLSFPAMHPPPRFWIIFAACGAYGVSWAPWTCRVMANRRSRAAWPADPQHSLTLELKCIVCCLNVSVLVLC